MKITPAEKDDARLIARSIMMGVGEEICRSFAAPDHTLADVETFFATLAARDDTQYSYRNTLVATDADGNRMGAVVSYNGALLEELRRPFFTVVKEQLGKSLGDVDDETEAGEFYIDTLAVLPEHRGKGVATALLKGAIERAARCGKPAGLLVDKDNARARKLYEKVGFRQVGERPFCYVMMDHLQHE